MTLHQYLTVAHGFHPAVADFYTRFAVDALAGTSEYVNAYTAISFLSAEYQPLFSRPGGTSAITRRLLRPLIPPAIAGATSTDWLANPICTEVLDLPNNAVRIRLWAASLPWLVGSPW